MIQEKTKNLIKKYADYRGALDERLTFDLLLEVFIAADVKERKIYVAEMKRYIKAVDEGKIERGVPIVVGELGS